MTITDVSHCDGNVMEIMIVGMDPMNKTAVPESAQKVNFGVPTCAAFRHDGYVIMTMIVRTIQMNVTVN